MAANPAGWPGPPLAAVYAAEPGALPLPPAERPACVLGHNWLAIQDTSLHARQPMSLGALSLVLNGEIYNFVELREQLRAQGESFGTASDTEVLLKLWQRHGPDCLPLLRGMFAFLIADAATGALWAVRDPFGIKPLYFVRSGRGLWLASEMRAFSAAGLVPRKVREGAALASLAGAHCFGAFETFYEGIQELPPGHWLRLQPGELEDCRRWYSLPPLTREIGPDDDCRELLSTLEQSVRVHARSSRRIASCLSGGLDSSTLVTLLGSHLSGETDFAAFTINTASEEDSELELAREVTSRANVRHKLFPIDSAISPLDALEMAVAYEVPNHVIGPINQFLLLRQIAASGATVVLDGQGGDELVSGYTWWWPALMRDIAGRGNAPLVEYLNARRRERLPYDAVTTASFDQIFYDAQEWLKGFLSMEFLGRPHEEFLDIPEFRHFFDHDGDWAQFRERAYYRDSLHFLLRQEDRLGMWFGLECRVPFVDVDLVRVAAKMSPELLVHEAYLKFPYRRMASGIPDSVRWCTRKRGFWETSQEKFPWLAETSLRIALDSPLLRALFPDMDRQWDSIRYDQQWRMLQVSLLERCGTRQELREYLRDVAPATLVGGTQA